MSEVKFRIEIAEDMIIKRHFLFVEKNLEQQKDPLKFLSAFSSVLNFHLENQKKPFPYLAKETPGPEDFKYL